MDDEEILSDGSDIDPKDVDDFAPEHDADEAETADEKRLRLAKAYLEEIEREGKDFSFI